MYVAMYIWVQVPEEGIRSYGVGLTGSCEQLDMIATNQSQAPRRAVSTLNH